MNDFIYQQLEYDIRCEWGLQGVQRLAPLSEAVIIVDVLSFSTCVEIATANGALVLPFAERGTPAQKYAQEQDALLASRTRTENTYSLAPASLMDIPAGTRLVLPSPNGSTLSMATGGTSTFAGCLRNATAVAQTVQARANIITVIPAGERWKVDHSLRPSLEDWVGAGAIIHALTGKKSPEAQAAEQAFLRFQHDLLACLQQIASGKELINQGFTEDVQLASMLNVSDCVPALVNGAYQKWG